ncbi:chemotaxis protein CheX [Pseudokineococcus sp. 1T1Z-3]|uniref:chemotaxis protein CheX n=1 Tax=Pseudokineococcus sp. 1T1Z-3 TaxID=3132745 RepID=UPI0030AE3A67
MDAAAAVSTGDMVALVGDLWTSVVPFPEEGAAPVEATWPSPAQAVVRGTVDVEGAADVEGAWSGSVVVSCDEESGLRWARAMLALEEDATAADVEDTVAEIANVLGGAVKAQCAGGGRLLLPVVDHGEVGVGPSDPRASLAVSLSWPDAPDAVFTVSLLDA